MCKQGKCRITKREIIRIIRGNDTPPVMKDKLMAYHENSIAAALSDMSVSERQRLYRILDVDDLSDVIEYAEESAVSGYLEEMDIKKESSRSYQNGCG